MTLPLITSRDAYAHARKGDLLGVAVSRFAAGEPAAVSSSLRQVTYRLSDTSVGRDGHRIFANAWQLGNYLRNPVFLWAHDASQPPIGRMVDIRVTGDTLTGTVQYAERDASPFADSVFQLVKGGFISAVSTSWLPLEWKFSADKGRQGGIDFTKVDLLEVSQVPVPALPSALAEGRARGIDTNPIYRWAEGLLDGGGSTIIPRTDLEALRRAAKMPLGERTRAFDLNTRAGRIAEARYLREKGAHDMARLAAQSPDRTRTQRIAVAASLKERYAWDDALAMPTDTVEQRRRAAAELRRLQKSSSR
jgi:HK97 family phage prohead protease